MRRATTIALTVAVLATLAPGTSRGAETVRIYMSNNRFCTTPVCTANENITISAGDIVEWVYSDAVCTGFAALGCYHTSTAVRPNGSLRWNSPDMPSNAQNGGTDVTVIWERTFNNQGDFPYFCAVHAGNGMAAQISVR